MLKRPKKPSTEQILAGTDPLTPLEQKQLVRAGAIHLGKANRIIENLELWAEGDERAKARNDAQVHQLQAQLITDCLLARGTRTGRSLGQVR